MQNRRPILDHENYNHDKIDSHHVNSNFTMISEVLNALFLTYVATEYQLSTAACHREYQQPPSLLCRPHILAGFAVVLIINVLDRVSGAAVIANEVIHRCLHVPKILLVILTYSIGLYIDCRRIQPTIHTCTFLQALLAAFLQTLPLYPLLAIAISFGFLILINLFQFLQLRLELLNMPIYYGTLYGPFSLVYFKVKRRVLEERSSLPTSHR
jgi:hypothetical protein